MDYLALGGLMLDDIVFPDGRTVMGAIGGSGAYAGFGMRLWSERVGVYGQVDASFDLALLDPLGLMADAVRVTERPTTRAWQLYEADGTRTQVWRVPNAVWQAQLAPRADALPELRHLRGVHMAARGLAAEDEVVGRILDAGVVLGVEPVIYAETPPERRVRVLETARRAAVFSPGEAEARLLFGDLHEDALLDALRELGCPHVVLRRGARGSVYAGVAAANPIAIPPAPADPVDLTGAGNAFCGGFLVGWLERQELRDALAAGAVSAALTIERVGVPPIDATTIASAVERRRAYRDALAGI
ncbi:MAG: hypothetical protein H6983_25785 [Ectothiorhodospiraceae bacterium]|nr:hypothetical protein [Chromatiales bacterium]MCP5157614.1 hypothetical protein [Ectothiorhodospiraceae bacterium]